MLNLTKDATNPNDNYSIPLNKSFFESIALNTIFAVAGFALAGVSFGLGLSTLLAFGGVGVSGASIRALRENLKIKSAAKEQIQGKTK